MISKFLFDDTDRYKDDVLNKCKLVVNGDRITIDCSYLVLQVHLYYESLQELLVGKIVTISNRSYDKHGGNKIQALKKVLIELERFHECFMLCVFGCLFHECEEIQETPIHSDIMDIINKLWLLIEDDEFDSEAFLKMEEARELKTYFASIDDLNELQNKLDDKWKQIVRECKSILRS